MVYIQWKRSDFEVEHITSLKDNNANKYHKKDFNLVSNGNN